MTELFAGPKLVYPKDRKGKKGRERRNTFMLRPGPFVLAGSGQASEFSELARFQASDAAASDAFATRLDISGDGLTIAVGAPNDNNSGGTDAGSVYIFIWNGTTYVEQTRLQASDAAATDLFGKRVKLSYNGDTCIVGAPQNNGSGADAGACYIFVRVAGVWSQQQRIVGSTTTTGDGLGTGVAISGDGLTVAIGAPFFGPFNTGKIYIFTSSAGVWTQQAALEQTGASNSDWFGWSVALTYLGDFCIVGSRRRATAWMFKKTAGVWALQANLTPAGPPTGTGSAAEGNDVAISGDGNYALMGCFGVDITAANDGAAYLWKLIVGVWTEHQTFQSPSPITSGWFGYHVSMSYYGDVILIGAGQEIRAHTFLESSGIWVYAQTLIGTGVISSDLYGRSVALSGDGDIAAISSVGDDNSGGADAGSFYVFTS